MTTKKAQHTPGPWFVHQPPAQAFTIYAGKLYGPDVATLAPYSMSSATSPMSDEGQANARLIASAPELLVAAQEALALIRALKDKYEGGRGVWAGEEALSRAIDKARGES